MDYANESYVRLYVRDTTTWKLLSWEARAVLCLLLRKVDRSGSLEVGDDGVAGVAAHIEVPVDMCERAIQQLVNPKRPVLVWDGHSFAFPNFIEAQETPSSDKQRAKESRANRRLKIVSASQNVTRESRNVTQPSHDVTDSHAASQPVTLSVLSLSASSADLSGKPDDPSLNKKATTAAPKLPGYHESIAVFDAAYRAAYGGKPTWLNEHFSNLKRLLKAHGAEEVQRRMGVLFNTPPTWLKPPFDFAIFVRQFDKLVGAKGLFDRGGESAATRHL